MSLTSLKLALAKHPVHIASATALAREHGLSDHKSALRLLKDAGYTKTDDGWRLTNDTQTVPADLFQPYNGLVMRIPMSVMEAAAPSIEGRSHTDIAKTVAGMIAEGKVLNAAAFLATVSYVKNRLHPTYWTVGDAKITTTWEDQTPKQQQRESNPLCLEGMVDSGEAYILNGVVHYTGQ